MGRLNQKMLEKDITNQLIVGIDEFASETKKSAGWCFFCLPEKAYKQFSFEANQILITSGKIKSFHGKKFNESQSGINENHLLKTEIEKLRLRIKELKKEIIIIKESEAFTTISGIDNWEDYFRENKRKLANQLKELEDGK